MNCINHNKFGSGFLQSCLCQLVIILLLIFGNLHVSGQDERFTVRGVIFSSETGLPLQDINISALNTQTEAISTDSLGKFEITLPGKNEQIIVSYPGYKTKTVYISGRDEVKIWLLGSVDRSVSDEVQMIYRDIPAKDIVGTVTSCRTIDLSKSSNQSFDSELQGKVAGLNVINRSGMPGEGAYMHLWGFNSLFSSGMPLVVVDGMIIRSEGFPNSIINGFHQNPFTIINQNDISSITLLKDATATALYGIKGSNGVLIINTQKPQGGKTTLDVSVYSGIESSPPNIPVLETGSFQSYIMEQMYNAEMSSEEIFRIYPFIKDDPDYLYYEKYNNNTNWQDEIFRYGKVRDAYLIVRGGDSRALYSLSGGYSSHEGIVTNTAHDRINFRFNSLVRITNKISVGINLGFSNSKYSLVETGGVYQTNPVYASLIKSPVLTVFQQNEQGIDMPVTETIDDFGFSNPYVLVHKTDASSNGTSFLGSSYLTYDITNKLSIHVNFGLNRDKANERLFIPAWGVAPQGDGSAERSMKTKVDQYISFLNEDRISYTTLLNYIHALSLDAGVRLMTNRNAQDYSLTQNSATDEFKNLNAGKSDERAVGGYDERWNWLSYFASAGYKLKDRYLLDVNLSIDASSRFGKEVNDGIKLFNHPFVPLPSAGVAWRISGEPFMSSLTFIDEIKIRASYGLTGSDDFGNYASRFYYVSVPYYSVTGFNLGGISNTGLKWETIKKQTIGIDLALFKERLIVNLDLYKAGTEDFITYIDLPAYYGYSKYIANGGECTNKGFDFNLYGKILNKTVKWEVDLNLYKYDNEIISLVNDPVISQFTGGEKISTTGEPAWMFYGYKSLGVFITQSDANAANLSDKAGRRFNAGDIHFADIDGNHIINEQDKTIIGNPHPDFMSGILNRLSYRNISLTAHLLIVSGNEVYNFMRSEIESMTGFENQSTAIQNRWVKEGHVTSVPKSSYDDPLGNARFSNRWLEDGSFVRLKRLTVSYTYPRSIYFLNNLTVFITGTNLITWSKYLGYDPEFSYSDGILGQGIDYGKVPQSRSVIIGMKIGL